MIAVLLGAMVAVLAYRYRRNVRGVYLRCRGRYYVSIGTAHDTALKVAWWSGRPFHGEALIYVPYSDAVAATHSESGESAVLAIETELARRGFSEVGCGLWRYND